MPVKLQRHWFWTNFPIYNNMNIQFDNVARASISDNQRKFGFDLSGYKISSRKKGQSRSDVLEKDQILRNCVDPKLGLQVFKSALTHEMTIGVENQT